MTGQSGDGPALVVVDVATRAVVDAIDAGSRVVASVAVDPAAGRAYILGEGAGDTQTLRVFDTAARKWADSVTSPGLWNVGPLIDLAS